MSVEVLEEQLRQLQSKQVLLLQQQQQERAEKEKKLKLIKFNISNAEKDLKRIKTKLDAVEDVQGRGKGGKTLLENQYRTEERLEKLREDLKDLEGTSQSTELENIERQIKELTAKISELRVQEKNEIFEQARKQAQEENSKVMEELARLREQQEKNEAIIKQAQAKEKEKQRPEEAPAGRDINAVVCFGTSEYPLRMSAQNLDDVVAHLKRTLSLDGPVKTEIEHAGCWKALAGIDQIGEGSKLKIEQLAHEIYEFKEEDIIEGKILGRGAFGIVHSCTLTNMRGRFAKKTLLLSQGKEREKTIQSFRNELNILRKLNHFNIVKLLGYVQTEDKIILVMDMYDSTLERAISDKFGVSPNGFVPKDIRRFLIDILKGLDYLHKNGVAHRDLKAENVLVLFEGASSVKSLHLTDLGVAKICEAGQEASTVAGTIPFMAPEIFKEKGYNPIMADIWSLGILIHEILVGEKPQRDLQEATKGKRPVLPKRVTADTRLKPFVSVYELCTKEDPKKRPIAEELLNTIEKIQV